MDIKLEITPNGTDGYLVVGRKTDGTFVFEASVNTIEDAGRFARAFVNGEES